MINNLKWWLFLIISTVIIIYFAPNMITAFIDEKLDKYQAEEMAIQFMEKNGYDLTDYHSRVARFIDYSIIGYLKSRLGTEKTKSLIEQGLIPDLQWDIRFIKNLPKDQDQISYRISVSPNGQIIQFVRSLPDTVTMISVSDSQALKIAEKIINEKTSILLDGFKLKTSNVNRHLNRTDYQFIWKKDADFTEGEFELNVTVQGNEVGSYNYDFNLPEELQKIISEKTTQVTMIVLIQIIVLIAIFIFALILFLKKYHDGEVSTSLGLILFMVVFFLGLLRSINEFPVAGVTLGIGNMSFRNVQIVAFFYEVLLKNVFIGIFLLTAWAVGESYARGIWPKKLNSIDSVLNRKFFTLSTGESILRGGSIGFIVAGAYFFIFSLITEKDSGVVQFSLPFDDIFQFLLPVLSVLIVSMIAALICEIVFRFFIINVVYQRWQKKWIAIFISAIFWTVGYSLFSNFPSSSLFIVNFSLAIIIGLFFAWLYFKYDLLTLITANAAANIIFYSLSLFTTSASWHHISMYLLLLAMLFPVAQVIISYIRKEEFKFSPMELPAHIKRISERERMKKELEIARNVQMGLLPKEFPKIAGYDISGICIPAKEVGGDYFDFVTLGPNKLGIAIGDVSGKGVPAAIYMTLTKGILQSNADDKISPKLVLNKVNKLLYKNIEKNSFVSMFYAILDLQEKKLTFARAGHNPGIMINQKDGNSQLLSTDGIALGLEEGYIFDQKLQELTIELNSGDTLVFYTDGITEAMNLRQEEFGEERFIEIISKNHEVNANKLIDLILQEVKRFTGNAAQHDDMTIVTVKIP